MVGLANMTAVLKMRASRHRHLLDRHFVLTEVRPGEDARTKIHLQPTEESSQESKAADGLISQPTEENASAQQPTQPVELWYSIPNKFQVQANQSTVSRGP